MNLPRSATNVTAVWLIILLCIFRKFLFRERNNFFYVIITQQLYHFRLKIFPFYCNVI